MSLDSIAGIRPGDIDLGGILSRIGGGIGAAPKPADVRFAESDLYGGSGPVESDIRQDALGDCYLVATLAAVARAQPHRIEDMIDFDPASGNFTVTLHDASGKPQSIEVTQAEVAGNLSRQGGSTADNTGFDRPIWPAVIETAYAKQHDSNPADGLAEGYTAIANGGWPKDAMRAITGDAGSEIRYSEGFFESQSSALDRMAGELGTALDNGRPVTAWSVEEDRSFWDKITRDDGTQDGLVDNHVYSVDSVYKNDDGEWMVSLRNPWATNNGVGEGHDTPGATIEVPLETLAETGGLEAFTVGPAN